MADKSKPTEHRPRYVFFFTGPTACGKSTVAKHVADQLDLSFLEGDDVSRGPPPPTFRPLRPAHSGTICVKFLPTKKPLPVPPPGQR